MVRTAAKRQDLRRHLTRHLAALRKEIARQYPEAAKFGMLPNPQVTESLDGVEELALEALDEMDELAKELG